MKKITFVVFTLIICSTALGQNNQEEISNQLVAEGRNLYKSEMASWYGTDIFLGKYENRENIGGYFSYVDGSEIKNIFFSNAITPKVIGTITFDSTFNVKTAKVEIIERDFIKLEQDIFVIRSRALLAIKGDTLFKTYEKTNFNLVPLISSKERKVYVITASKENGFVIFGNDYLLTFDNMNNLISKKQIHRNILRTKYGKVDGKVITEGFHTHVTETGDFITPTDICTIMLNEKIAKWQEFCVVSKNYFSIWNCETDNLLILTTEAAKTYFEQKDKDRKKN